MEAWGEEGEVGRRREEWTEREGWVGGEEKEETGMGSGEIGVEEGAKEELDWKRSAIQVNRSSTRSRLIGAVHDPAFSKGSPRT